MKETNKGEKPMSLARLLKSQIIFLGLLSSYQKLLP